MQLGMTEFKTALPVDTADLAGFCAGTTIMTLDGEMPVEHLTPGDRVITRDSGMAILKDIKARTVKAQPVRIKAGSLGHTRPDRDMMVMPGTALHIRDWRAEAIFGAPAALVPAHRLVDGEFVATQDARDMTVYTLTFDRAHIVYADGMEIATA